VIWIIFLLPKGFFYLLFSINYFYIKGRFLRKKVISFNLSRFYIDLLPGDLLRIFLYVSPSLKTVTFNIMYISGMFSIKLFKNFFQKTDLTHARKERSLILFICLTILITFYLRTPTSGDNTGQIFWRLFWT